MTIAQIRQQQRQGTANRVRPVESMLPRNLLNSLSGPPMVAAPRIYTPNSSASGYTTAGTVYNPQTAAPIQPPVRKTRAPRWYKPRDAPGPRMPNNQHPNAPARYPPHIITYGRNRHDTNATTQQKSDRGITPQLGNFEAVFGSLKGPVSTFSPRLEGMKSPGPVSGFRPHPERMTSPGPVSTCPPHLEGMTSPGPVSGFRPHLERMTSPGPVSTFPPHLEGMTFPGPDVGGGSLPQGWRNAGPAGTGDDQHQDEDPGFAAAVDVLASQFNAKALTNLASYKNPSQKAAQRALDRARPVPGRPAASKSESLGMSRGQNASTRDGLGAYRASIRGYIASDSPGPDARVSRSLGDGCAPIDDPNRRDDSTHSATRKAAFDTVLKTISPRSAPRPPPPGAPQPLTAGPPGLRKYQPSRGPSPSTLPVYQGSSDPGSSDPTVSQESSDPGTSVDHSTDSSGWLADDESMSDNAQGDAQHVYPDLIQSMIDDIVNCPQLCKIPDIAPPFGPKLAPIGTGRPKATDSKAAPFGQSKLAPIGTGRPKATDSKVTGSKATGSKVAGSKAADPKAADPKAIDPKAVDSKAPAPAVSKPVLTPSLRLYYPFGLPPDFKESQIPSCENLEQYCAPRRTHAPRTREELDRHQKRVDASWYANVKSTPKPLDDPIVDAKERYLLQTIGRFDLARAMAMINSKLERPEMPHMSLDEDGPSNGSETSDPWVIIDNSEAGPQSFFASK